MESQDTRHSGCGWSAKNRRAAEELTACCQHDTGAGGHAAILRTRTFRSQHAGRQNTCSRV